MARIVVLLLIILGGSTLSAAPAGLFSLEGDVTVLRNGVLISSEKVTEGFPLEDFDTISTGSTGKAEVRLSPTTGVGGTVRLDPSTALYLDLTPLRAHQSAGVELLTGGVTVALSSLSEGSSLDVRTEVAALGGSVGGFRVVVSAAGDLLAEAINGRLSSLTDGRATFLEPGSVAEISTLDRNTRTRAVNPSTLASYEASWVRQRNQTFRDQSTVYFRALASRYQLQGGQFQRAWDRMQRESKDDSQGAPGAVAHLRRAAFPLERSQYRVEALGKLFTEGTLDPALELTRGYTAQDFFHQIAREQEPWRGQLALARGLYRAQADLHGGEFPQTAEGVQITYDSAYFH